MQQLSLSLKRYRQSVLIGGLLGFGAAVIFIVGFSFRGFIDLQTVRAADRLSDTDSYPVLDEVQMLLNQHYLRSQPSSQVREYAAIRGMLSSLNDRYTFFIEPPVAQSESDVLAGTYGGVGVQIIRSEEGHLVLFPFDGSPALSANIHAGDILLAVNGMPVGIDQQPDVIDQMLRGEVKEGSGVDLTIRRPGETDEFTVFVPFAVINVPSVVWRVLDIDNRIGYVQILLFTSRTPDELKEALAYLREQSVESLILDLRNNSGGLLQESVEVASQFLHDSVVVYEKDNHSDRAISTNADNPLAADLPIVVLVNQGTASAAELVAGAIRDNDRGILIGQTTFGKGTVQQIYRLSDDSSLHITAAEWFTPDHQGIDGTGLEPTIAMIPDPNGRDVELGEATRYLGQVLKEGA